jgi:hypothetical protein
MDGWSIVLFVFVIIIGIIGLYEVIQSTVRRGINTSIIGQYLEEKHDIT